MDTTCWQSTPNLFNFIGHVNRPHIFFLAEYIFHPLSRCTCIRTNIFHPLYLPFSALATLQLSHGVPTLQLSHGVPTTILFNNLLREPLPLRPVRVVEVAADPCYHSYETQYDIVGHFSNLLIKGPLKLSFI